MVSVETKSNQHQESTCLINCLPGDLIERIFLRLPVSSLLSCTGVCRHWYNFIQDPQFVRVHLQHAPSCTLLFFPPELIGSMHYPSDAIIFDEAWSQSTWSVPVIGPDDFLCGSCNGLICLYSKRTKIKIANPATSECLHLDKPVKSSRGDHFSFYKFGFHPATKEYKIAHFLGDHRKYSRGTFSVIQVFTLGSEKWRDIRTPEVLSLSCVKKYGAVIVDGTMYWLTEDSRASWKHAVITFDLSEETFARIQLPAAPLGDSNNRWYWITEIDGNVCIATAEVDRHLPKLLAGELQIWTLDKKVQKMWSQNYIIQHAPSYIPGPHFFHRDKIMMQNRDCNLYLYDLLDDNCKMKLSNMVQLFDFSPHKPEKMQCYIFSKSLVRLDAYRNVGTLPRPKQREGWELKKWEVWEREFRKVEDLWCSVYQLEQNTLCLGASGMRTKEILQQLPDDVVCQRISMEISQILQSLPDCPYQHPRSLHRLSWFELKRDMEKLLARVEGLKDMVKVSHQACNDMNTTLRSLADHLRVEHTADSTG